MGEPDVKVKTENVNGESSKRKNTNDADRLAKRRKLAAARRRKQRKGQRYYSGDSEDEKLKKRLLKRGATGTKSKKNGEKNRLQGGTSETVDVPLIREIKSKSLSKGKKNSTPSDSDTVKNRQFEILNPDSYKRLVSRFEENQINKAPKPTSGEFLESRFICTLCQQPPASFSLGDLFGPYYLKISPDSFWPPYLKAPKLKKSSHETYTDFWFHGCCALWASGILAKGNMLIGLDEHLPDYWKQKCSRCQVVGASMGCIAKGCKKIYHYPCAVEADCSLQEENLTMHCDGHKKFCTITN